MIVLPISDFGDFSIVVRTRFASASGPLILANVAIALQSGLLALLMTGTNLSGLLWRCFLALFECRSNRRPSCWSTAQLRSAGHTIESAAIDCAVLASPQLMTLLLPPSTCSPCRSRGIRVGLAASFA